MIYNTWNYQLKVIFSRINASTGKSEDDSLDYQPIVFEEKLENLLRGSLTWTKGWKNTHFYVESVDIKGRFGKVTCRRKPSRRIQIKDPGITVISSF